MPELLNVQGLTAGYGEAIVLTDVTFKLAEGKALALLGRNGMGKTTLVNSIIGVTRDMSAAPSASTAAISPGCAPTNARMPASAGCRRSAIFSAR